MKRLISTPHLTSLSIIILLYTIVSLTSYGYDDEFFNINLIERTESAWQLITSVNQIDIHPPGSYLINWTLFHLFGSWSHTRLIGAIGTAFSLWILWYATKKENVTLFSFVAICLNPTILLWGATLRWYTYALPIINFMIYLLIRRNKPRRLYWEIFFLLSVILFYISYIAIIIVPIFFTIALFRHRKQLADKIRPLLWSALGAAILISPQLFIFYRVHLPNGGAQFGGYLRSFGGLGLHFLAGQASYPFALAGLASTLGNLLLMMASLAHFRALIAHPPTQFVLLGSLSLVFTRLSRKFRNLVTLSSAQGLWQNEVYHRIRHRRLRLAIFLLIGFANIWGVINVVSHSNTAKGNWNMPYSQILATIQAHAQECNASTLITSDPGIAYHGRKIIPNVINLHYRADWEAAALSKEGCIIAINTFRGSLNRARYQEYKGFLERHDDRLRAIIPLGPDRHAEFKRRFAPDIPDHYAVIYVVQLE